LGKIVAVKIETRPALPRIALGDKRFPPTRFAAILEVAAEAGVATGEVLRGSGLDEDALRNPQTRTSTEQLLLVGRNLLIHCPGSGVGLRVAERLHLSAHGMVGYALLCAANLRQAFDFAARYHPLTGAVMSLRWFERGDRAVWAFPTVETLKLERADLEIDLELFRFILEMQMMVVVVGVKDMMGPACSPALARIAMGAPPYAKRMVEAMGCPVEFDQPVNELHYPAAWLDMAPLLANPITAAQISNGCAQMLRELELHSGVSRRVVEELTRTPGDFPSMEAIARELHMTSRNLRRKLEAEGTAYQALLANVRHALAKDYLSRSFLSTDDIALSLGFSDVASFRHAFKRWTGMTPSEFRG